MKSRYCKMERKDVEKNRRLHMKGLCLKLSSLIPAASPSTSKQDGVTQLDHLDNAAAYIRQLKERIHRLKQRKEAPDHGRASNGAAPEEAVVAGGMGVGVSMPVIEVRYQDATLDVVLISKVGEPFKLHQVIAVLEQEGAEVVNATFSVVGDKIFYTIHSQALSATTGLQPHRLRDLLLQLH